MSVAVALLALTAAGAPAPEYVTLGNSVTAMSFSTDSSSFGSIVHLTAANKQEMVTGSTSGLLWSVTVADASGSQYTLSPAAQTCADANYILLGSQLNLSWASCKAADHLVNVTLAVSLSAVDNLFTFQLKVSSSGNALTLWNWAFKLANVVLNDGSSLLENNGFGIVRDCSASNRLDGPPINPGGSRSSCDWTDAVEGMFLEGCADDGNRLQGCFGFPTLREAQEACELHSRCAGVTRTNGAFFELRRRMGMKQSFSGGETSWAMKNLAQCHPDYQVAGSCSSFFGGYPSAQATLQYLAAYDPASAGVYIGTHDKHGSTKSFQATVGTGSVPTVDFTISAVAENAGKPLQTHVVDFPIVVGCFTGDWWDASQIYRSWVLPNADWTQAGPLRTRADHPKWLDNTTVWVNSHWQGNDIFNTTGGDPKVVENGVLAVQKRFGLGQALLGLHWYEWDLLGYEAGSDYTKCGSEITCGFDTHYPEYFPVRDGFNATMASLRSAGVRVTPYINGRIFDIATKTWGDDKGYNYAAKQASPRLNLGSSDLSAYNESYGSKAEFNVMCPATQYWDDVIAGTVKTIVNELKTDGVYLDQIASAGARQCWDSTHGHPIGGGSHWVSGYRSMLAQARAGIGNDTILLTESNAESFMDGINVYLSLTGYASAPFTGPERMVNAFSAVYGGYFGSMGAEFFQADFAPDPNVFSAKNAQMFLFGSQIGWYSLIGRDNQNPPMGVQQYLLDDQYTPEIEYLRALSDAKLLVSDWLVYGSAARDLPVTSNSSRTRISHGHPRGVKNGVKLGVAYNSLGHACYVLDTPGALRTMMCLFTAVERNVSCDFQVTVDKSKYGLQGSPVYVQDYMTGSQVYSFPSVGTFNYSVEAHAVTALLFYTK
ncbi:putative glycoside hydrolase [Diplonema papillatum]|nr:putative glycoside hydrolase [Diplonema papillatum]|eukprot:gene2439-3789_t